MNKIELLLPAGDFECLKAAVQNGADAVYLGSSHFNARNSATNFDMEELERAINYAHLRNVKVHLTLNTLIKNDELISAINLAKQAYELGIDAILVQDLGLAHFLINHFPDLPIHASTQMTCHNLVGAQYLEKMGFKRIVLSRELSLSEIEYIKSNVSTEIEVFAHGALCISYSGQCLYSSLIGGRSGNRGKCAQGCRLPYSLLENNKVIDQGYLLSPKDLSSLELLPDLVHTNVDSLKIEGRMKSPEYVATVARIYRKYLDKILHHEYYIVEEQDKKDLLQVFNRGGFSSGHLTDDANKELIYKEKPSNMGIYIGTISNYHPKLGHISLTSKSPIEIGDTITFEKEPTTYKISELMMNGNNLPVAQSGDKITIGRMKGNLHVGDKIFKIASKKLNHEAKTSYSGEYKKSSINCVLDVHLDEPIKFRIFDSNGLEVSLQSEEIPEIAVSSPITKERLEKQLRKTANTPFDFKNIKINLDKNVHISHISEINRLRRDALDQYSKMVIEQYKRHSTASTENPSSSFIVHEDHKLCVLFHQLNLDDDYSKLNSIDKLYIPLKYFCNKTYQPLLKYLTDRFSTYIYMPTIMKGNYQNLLKANIDHCLETFTIKGFVVSNIGQFELLKEWKEKYEFISNYTLNIFNNVTIKALDCKVVTISPELNKAEVNDLSQNTDLKTEFIVYGRIPLMTAGYCLLGKSNKCYPECDQKCKNNHQYYLKDRMNFRFRILPDSIQTITTIYNSKINSIDTQDMNIDHFRIDILDESIEEINHIIDVVKSRNRLEGEKYTNGNIKRIV